MFLVLWGSVHFRGGCNKQSVFCYHTGDGRTILHHFKTMGNQISQPSAPKVGQRSSDLRQETSGTSASTSSRGCARRVSRMRRLRRRRAVFGRRGEALAGRGQVGFPTQALHTSKPPVPSNSGEADCQFGRIGVLFVCFGREW